MSWWVTLLLHFSTLVVLWFHPKSPGYLVSVSSSSKQCQVCVLSCGEGPNANQILVGYSLKLCVTIALVYLADMTPLLIKGFCGRDSAYISPWLMCIVPSSTKRHWHVRVKATCTHQLNFSILKEPCRCYLQ